MILDIISKHLGSITTIAVFIAGFWLYFRKFSKLVERINTILEDYPKMQETVKEHSEYIKDHEDFSHILQEKLEGMNTTSEKDMELTLCMSREKLLTILTKAINRGHWLDSTELMVAQRLIDAYVAAGGNSEICIMWSKAKILPILVEE